MDKQIVYPFNGILLSNKLEQTTDSCDSMVESQIMLNKSSQTQKSTELWLYLFEVLEEAKLISNARNQIIGCVGMGMRLALKSQVGAFWDHGSVLDLNQGGGHMNAYVCQTHWTVHLEWGHFIVCNCTLKISMLHFNKCRKKRRNLSMVMKARIVVTTVGSW